MSVQRWSSAALRCVSRGAYRMRRLLARRSDAHDQRKRDSIADLEQGRLSRGRAAHRNILFITVDQQRFDALRINGGTIATCAGPPAIARPSSARRTSSHTSI